MRATSYSVLAGYSRAKLKLVVVGSRPSVVCLRVAKSPGLPWGYPVAEGGPSWAGGTRERPSGEIRDQTPGRQDFIRIPSAGGLPKEGRKQGLHRGGLPQPSPASPRGPRGSRKGLSESRPTEHHKPRPRETDRSSKFAMAGLR
jgi:hypothetical protein